jgi:hypothetical protein
VYTDEQILEMFVQCNFNNLCCGNYSYQVNDCLRNPVGVQNIDDNIWFKDGASKMVIGWDNQDWVIKIPFFCGGGSSSTMCYSCGHSDCEDCSRSSYGEDSPFYGAKNTENDWDYCLKEVELYQEACSAGIEEFFAETRRIGFVHNYPIYIQRKIDIIGLGNARWDEILTFSPEQVSITQEISQKGNYLLHWEALIFAMKTRGREITEKLVEFIIAWEIGDLHDNNYGFCGDQLILIDYSGYNS